MVALPVCTLRFFSPLNINLMYLMKVAVVVSLIYWSLLLLFPSLIIPAMGADAAGSSSAAPLLFYLPLHVDLSLHAVPAISLILDFFLFEKKYSQREIGAAPFIAVAFASWYAIWLEHCATMNNGICTSLLHCMLWNI